MNLIELRLSSGKSGNNGGTSSTIPRKSLTYGLGIRVNFLGSRPVFERAMVIQSIRKWEEKHPGQVPFIKQELNMALHLRHRVAKYRGAPHEGHFIELNCREAMMIECYPNYHNLDEKEKKLRRKYNRYVEHGEILRLIMNLSNAELLFI